MTEPSIRERARHRFDLSPNEQPTAAMISITARCESLDPETRQRGLSDANAMTCYRIGRLA